MHLRVGVLFVLFLLLAGRAAAQPAAGQWLVSLEEAQARARATNRPVLIEFSGTDWCEPCVRLRREVFDTPEFLAWAGERVILLRADFPRLPQNQLSPEQTRANADVLARYNPQGDFPVEVVLGPDGKVLARLEGYHAGGPAAYCRVLTDMLKLKP